MNLQNRKEKIINIKVKDKIAFNRGKVMNKNSKR